MTIMELLIAIAFLGISLLALATLLLRGYLDVTAGGRVSQTTSYARQKMEELRNEPFNPGPTNNGDTPETGMARTWTIAPVGATVTPNRLARITVTVIANQTTGMTSSSRTALETMRAE